MEILEITVIELTIGIILAFAIGFFAGVFATSRTLQANKPKKKEPIEGYG